ncbi:MAG: glycosyltransferase family 9 protein [Kiritimatiellae bacterium]|nr:glycosyltransferase family 9 protein [Kiritimatiellia bacterium]
MPTRRPSPDQVRRLLVVKLSSLGDLFHALPTVRALKRASGATVDWLVQPAYVPLVDCFTDVDRVLSFPRQRIALFLVRFLQELRRERYDLVVDAQGLLKSAIPARLTRRSRRAPVLGPSFHREGSRMFYSAVAGPRNKARHAVDENLDVIRWLGWPMPETLEFPVRFPSVPRIGPGPVVGLVPASRWPTKNWPPEYFADLARRLMNTGAQILLMGGRAERPVCDEIERSLGPGGGVVNCAGETSLPELGGRMATCDLVVTVDSGPMHIAAALGRPVLALFGPTDPTRTGPYGRLSKTLWVDGLSCRPCFSRTCARNDVACMCQLYPSRVAEVALNMLRSSHD